MLRVRIYLATWKLINIFSLLYAQCNIWIFFSFLFVQLVILMFMYNIVNERLTFELITEKWRRRFIYSFSLFNFSTLLILALNAIYCREFILIIDNAITTRYLKKRKNTFLFSFSKFAFIVNTYLFYLSYHII